jgi:hypothetical protein
MYRAEANALQGNPDRVTNFSRTLHNNALRDYTRAALKGERLTKPTFLTEAVHNQFIAGAKTYAIGTRGLEITGRMFRPEGVAAMSVGLTVAAMGVAELFD